MCSAAVVLLDSRTRDVSSVLCFRNFNYIPGVQSPCFPARLCAAKTYNNQQPNFPLSSSPNLSQTTDTPPIIIASVRVVAGLILLKGKEKSARVETSETDFRRCGRKMSGRPLSWMLHQRSKCPSCVRPSSGRSASSSTPPGINSLGSRR